MDTLALSPVAPKTCRECGLALRGRVDKKFCSDYCRSAFHNKSQGGETAWMRQLWRILTHNRAVLRQLYEAGKCRVSRSRLLLEGFLFQYCTACREESGGAQHFFCFDYGYQVLEEGAVLILHRPDLEMD